MKSNPTTLRRHDPNPGKSPVVSRVRQRAGVRVVVQVAVVTCVATIAEGRTPTTAAAKAVSETAAEGDRTVAKNRPTASLVKRAIAPIVRQVAGHPNPTSAAESNKAGPMLPTDTVQTAQIVPIDGSLAGTTGHDVAAQT